MSTIVDTPDYLDMVLDELLQKSKPKQIDMNQSITKKLFLKKVLKELQTHPYYHEKKQYFDRVVHKIERFEKHYAMKYIVRSLEETFKYKLQHKKKFQHVMEELIFKFNKKKYQHVLDELLMTFDEKVNEKVNEKEYLDIVDYFILIFVFVMLFLQLYGELFNWFGN